MLRSSLHISKKIIIKNKICFRHFKIEPKKSLFNIFSKDTSTPNWNRALSTAEELVLPARSTGSVINPRELLGSDLELITKNISKLLGSGHPVLNTISNYYFSQRGKHIRPLIVLLMSQATSMTRDDKKFQLDQKTLDTPISSLDNSLLNNTGNPLILPSQKRLAEITEMIHTASLLHDDVIDTSFQRRSQPSANAEFGNKMAILAGDFLLARASTALARLRNVEVVELLATVISNLVEGEFMQLRNSSVEGDSKIGKFDYYLEKTYLKTASLIALSCKACVVLGGSGDKYSEMAFNYGKNVGLAFQLIDDMLDFVVTADQMGKPVNADLKLGLATAPILYAAETYPELWALIERKFAEEGDEKLALNLALKSDGIKRTKELAEKYIKEAVDSISPLPPSQAKDALIYLTHSVINRKK